MVFLKHVSSSWISNESKLVTNKVYHDPGVRFSVVAYNFIELLLLLWGEPCPCAHFMLSVAVFAFPVGCLRRYMVAQAPLEACGLLAGKMGVVDAVLPVKNAAGSAVHFRMEPDVEASLKQYKSQT